MSNRFHSWPQPPGGTTANDARTLAGLLRDPQLAAYPDDQVRVLLDARATRTNILDELEALAKRAHGGTALIFFAGHGEPVGEGYALLPSDADLKDLASTALTAEVFHQRVAKVRASAKRLVVLLNCCHTGGLGDAVLDTGAELLSGAAPPADFYRPLAVGSGQAVISSSRPTQKSGARSNANAQPTPFGAQLLAALRGQAPGTGRALKSRGADMDGCRHECEGIEHTPRLFSALLAQQRRGHQGDFMLVQARSAVRGLTPTPRDVSTS